MTYRQDRFAGKVAFVTGAGSGIGQATAVAFARSGARVALADMSEAGLASTEELIQGFGGTATSIRCDVTSSDDVKDALDRAVRSYGRLDIAHNNAGIEHPPLRLHEIDEATWDRVMDVNLRGVYLCMKHEIGIFLAQGSGSIVNTSSGAGILAMRGIAPYCASKWGVRCITQVAALEYAKDNIRVNSVCPGFIDTPMADRYSGGTDEGRANVIAQAPIGRWGLPTEIAEAVMWLSSDDASYVTGHAMVVDGGQTAGV